MTASDQPRSLPRGSGFPGKASDGDILFVTRKWPPAVGGIETYCVRITEELSKLRNVTILSLEGEKDGSAPRSHRLLGFFLRAAWYLCRNRGRYDVVHFSDLVLGPLAVLNAFLDRAAINVISAHGTDAAYTLRQGLKPAIYRHYMSWLARNQGGIAAIVANSEATGRLCRRLGLRNLHVVRLATDLSPSATADLQPKPYLLYVGRLVRRKGVSWFVREVLPGLPRDLDLKVAGTIWEKEEGRILDHPRDQFLGPVFGADLAKLRREATAVVVPNIKDGDDDFTEGFGLAALEAAADQGVVVASRLDGLIDAVEDGETGFLVAPRQADAWTKKILAIRAWSAQQRQRFVEGARDRVRRDYGWDRVASETIRIYEGCESKGKSLAQSLPGDAERPNCA